MGGANQIYGCFVCLTQYEAKHGGKSDGCRRYTKEEIVSCKCGCHHYYCKGHFAQHDGRLP